MASQQFLRLLNADSILRPDGICPVPVLPQPKQIKLNLSGGPKLKKMLAKEKSRVSDPTDRSGFAVRSFAALLVLILVVFSFLLLFFSLVSGL
jgi:hypothetical protein